MNCEILILKKKSPIILPANRILWKLSGTQRANKLRRFLFFFKFAFFAGTTDFAFGREDQKRRALRTDFACGFGPKSEFAVRVAAARIEGAALLAAALRNIAFFAFRAFDPGGFLNIFNCFAFRIAAAAKKRAKTALFDDHWRAAIRAFFVRNGRFLNFAFF